MSGESRLFEAGEIGFDLADGDAEARENVAHEPVGAAVELGGGDDFVAGFERGEQRVGDGGHAGGGDDGGFGAFECGDFAFGDGERGIAVARVDVGFAFAFGPALHFGGGGEGEGGGAADRRADRAADAVAVAFAGVDGLGLGAEGAGRGCLALACGFFGGRGFHDGAILGAVGRRRKGPIWRRAFGRRAG